MPQTVVHYIYRKKGGGKNGWVIENKQAKKHHGRARL